MVILSFDNTTLVIFNIICLSLNLWHSSRQIAWLQPGQSVKGKALVDVALAREAHNSLRLRAGPTSRSFKRSSARYWQDSLELACLPAVKAMLGAMGQLGSTGMALEGRPGHA